MSVPFRSKQSAVGLLDRVRTTEHTPMSAMIEIADRCNEVCVHCYQVQGQKGEMTTEEVFRVLDELAELGVLFLTISGGEPTLRSDFLEIVEHARKLKFAVKVFTNGLRLDQTMAHRLGDLAVQEVQMSLYSHRAEVHDWVTGVPGSFEKTVQAARDLIAAGVSVVLKTPVMSLNVDDYEPYIEFVSGLGAEHMLDPHVDPREDGDRITERLRIAEQDYLRLKRDKRLARPRSEEEDARRTPNLDRGVCAACSGNVHVEPNGEMRPCTQLGVSVGHALKDGVRRAWESNEEALQIRHLTWRDLHGCRDCDLQPYCGRCFANARLEVGDALGPYATACRRAVLEYELAHGEAPQLLRGEDGREPTLGPYTRDSPGVFRAAPDRITPRDEELARRASWVRGPAAEGSADARDAGSSAANLVQIRRPNQKRSSWHSPPGDNGRNSTGSVLE